MKYIIILLTLLFLAPMVYADDSTAAAVASSILRQLDYDTTGTARLPRALALRYARGGIGRVGTDIGKDTAKVCTLAAYAWGVKVDTALIEVVAVVYDSSSYPRRALTEIPYSEINKFLFSGEINSHQHATHYAQLGDSIFLGPLTSEASVFRVQYLKQHKYLADSTTVTDLPQKYRDLAVLWGCYRASERLQNGRAQEFLERYIGLRNDAKTGVFNTGSKQ